MVRMRQRHWTKLPVILCSTFRYHCLSPHFASFCWLLPHPCCIAYPFRCAQAHRCGNNNCQNHFFLNGEYMPLVVVAVGVQVYAVFPCYTRGVCQGQFFCLNPSETSFNMSQVQWTRLWCWISIPQPLKRQSSPLCLDRLPHLLCKTVCCKSVQIFRSSRDGIVCKSRQQQQKY